MYLIEIIHTQLFASIINMDSITIKNPQDDDDMIIDKELKANPMRAITADESELSCLSVDNVCDVLKSKIHHRILNPRKDGELKNHRLLVIENITKGSFTVRSGIEFQMLSGTMDNNMVVIAQTFDAFPFMELATLPDKKKRFEIRPILTDLNTIRAIFRLRTVPTPNTLVFDQYGDVLWYEKLAPMDRIVDAISTVPEIDMLLIKLGAAATHVFTEYEKETGRPRSQIQLQDVLNYCNNATIRKALKEMNNDDISNKLRAGEMLFSSPESYMDKMINNEEDDEEEQPALMYLMAGVTLKESENTDTIKVVTKGDKITAIDNEEVPGPSTEYKAIPVSNE